MQEGKHVSIFHQAFPEMVVNGIYLMEGYIEEIMPKIHGTIHQPQQGFL